MKTRLVLILVIFSFVFSGLKAQVNVGDSLALVDLYNSTNGPHWTNHTNWLTNNPVSSWYGITVKNRKVTVINLPENKLQGELPVSIGNFDSLVNLALIENELTGALPTSIGNLKAMRLMSFINNQLTGTIPASVGDMTELRGFICNNNKITGSLPQTIGRCKNLSDLELYANKLTGLIPASLNECTALQTLWLASNQLSGALPSLKNLINVSTFNISDNNLNGTLDGVFPEEGSLNSLDISQNHFSGSLPSSLGNLKSLSIVYLSDNQFSGSVPPALFTLPYLKRMDLSNNLLTETINPHYKGDLVNGKFIYVQKNRFTFNGLEYLTQKYGGHLADSPQARIAIHLYQNKLAVSAGGTLKNNTYQWFTEGTSVPVVVKGDSTFRPIESGRYHAAITNEIVTKLILFTDTITYTAPLKSVLAISISPNPARGMILIYGLDEKSDGKITIADMSGYVWMSVMSRKQTSLQVNVSRLKAGNYLVNVNDGKGVKTIEFVKE